MYLYHGTSVENALKILEARELKGKKADRKHNNRYVAFSRSLLEARTFGEVVFRFPAIERATRVEYENKNWIDEHAEMVEFLLSQSRPEDELNLATLLLEKEEVLVNKHVFADEPVTVYIINKDMEKLTESRQQLKPFLLEDDTVVRSVSLYNDFVESLKGE